MLAVAHAHDLFDRAFVVLRPRRHFKATGQRVLVDYQRVVARCLVAVGQAGEHALALMPDRRGLAVHDPSRAYHAPAAHLADRLVTQANAKDRAARTERGDRLDEHTYYLQVLKSNS